jgi:RNA polymerase sigma factor (sigma-70 family)
MDASVQSKRFVLSAWPVQVRGARATARRLHGSWTSLLLAIGDHQAGMSESVQRIGSQLQGTVFLAQVSQGLLQWPQAGRRGLLEIGAVAAGLTRNGTLRAVRPLAPGRVTGSAGLPLKARRQSLMSDDRSTPSNAPAYRRPKTVWLALVASLAISLLGLRAVLDPVSASAGFGLPMHTGSETAFVQIYGARNALLGALQGRVYGLALRMLGHPQDAEDASQEILVQIATHLSQFRGQSQLSTWAYRIAARHLVRFRRSRAETAAMEVQQVAGAIDLGLAATQPHALPEGDARLLEEEVRLTCTQAMLLCLSRHERIAYLLGQVLGADDETGARICGISAQAFRQRLSRARRTLEPLLAERCGLANPDNPCSCRRQAAAKQLLGPIKVRLAALPREAESVTRANEQLRGLNHAGHVFAIHPPIAAPEALWRRICAAVPDLTR